MLKSAHLTHQGFFNARLHHHVNSNTKNRSPRQHRELCSVLCDRLEGRSLGENGYMYMYVWVPSCSPENIRKHHNIVKQLYPNTKQNVPKEKKKDYKETLVIFSIFTSEILFLSSLKGMPKFSALPLYMFYWFWALIKKKSYAFGKHSCLFFCFKTENMLVAKSMWDEKRESLVSLQQFGVALPDMCLYLCAHSYTCAFTHTHTHTQNYHSLNQMCRELIRRFLL